MVGHELGAVAKGLGLLNVDAVKTLVSLFETSCEGDGEDVVGLSASVGARVAWNWLEAAHAFGLVLNTVEDVAGILRGLASRAAVGHGGSVGEEVTQVLLPVLLCDEFVSLGGVNAPESVGSSGIDGLKSQKTLHYLNSICCQLR